MFILNFSGKMLFSVNGASINPLMVFNLNHFIMFYSALKYQPSILYIRTGFPSYLSFRGFIKGCEMLGILDKAL